MNGWSWGGCTGKIMIGRRMDARIGIGQIDGRPIVHWHRVFIKHQKIPIRIEGFKFFNVRIDNATPFGSNIAILACCTGGVTVWIGCFEKGREGFVDEGMEVFDFATVDRGRVLEEDGGVDEICFVVVVQVRS